MWNEMILLTLKAVKETQKGKIECCLNENLFCISVVSQFNFNFQLQFALL